MFTSGGTESVALAIWGGVRAIRELGTRVVIGAAEHPAVGGVCHVLESDGFEVVMVPVDARRADRHGSVRGRDPHPRHAARQRAAREPRAGNPATGGRGRPPRAGVARPVPHRRVPDGRTAPGERRGARGRPALALCAQVRRTARRRGALRPAWGGRHRVSRAATTANASVGRAWRTRRASPRWRPRSRRRSPTWPTARHATGRSPGGSANGSPRTSPGRASTVTRRTGRRTWCASASRGSIPRR